MKTITRENNYEAGVSLVTTENMMKLLVDRNVLIGSLITKFVDWMVVADTCRITGYGRVRMVLCFPILIYHIHE